MKKLKLLIVSVLAAFAFMPAQAAFAADPTVQNEDAMAATSDAVAEFWDFYDSNVEDTSDSYYTRFSAQALKTEGKLADAERSMTTEGLSGDTAKSIAGMKKAIGHARQAIADWRTASDKNDMAAADRASIKLDNATDEYNKAYDDYSQAEYMFTDAQYALIYGGIVLAAGGLTVWTFVWAKRKNTQDKSKSKRSEELRKQRKVVARESLWPLAGAVITFVTYFFPIGDTYFVMWGAILFGLLFFGRAVAKYREMLGNAAPATQTK